jgi:restriction system protein
MAIPDYQSTILPLLKYTADGKDHPIREVIETLADQFNLTEQERRELLPSGQQAIFDNRVAWARTYMKKAGLPEAPRRGHIRITKRGMDVIAFPCTSNEEGFVYGIHPCPTQALAPESGSA